MSTTTSIDYSSLTSTSSTDTDDTDTEDTSSSTLDADDFITILLAELEYQDPTEPVDNADMIAQMTGYSQLEQLTEMNEKMDTLTESLDDINATNSLSYLGMEVEASGYTLYVEDGDSTDLYFELEEDAAEVDINIYNSSGTIVQTETYTDVDEGTNTFTWDGLDSDGDTVDDGYYYAVVTAYDDDGDELDVTTTTTGTVSGISNTDDGLVLTLSDGRTVYMSDVTYVTQ